ncbi:hypothetical protein CHS0354_012701 [Potamilus streckersoni]|uniref:Uncharacterized protein n=1 Tax=Potamilus streckersoni TaxID=2493646 RepID=A0AAE0SYK2_9BIVA|nr:hypothetical protein CHS0354_012701 [Potamilus streckersoni]
MQIRDEIRKNVKKTSKDRKKAISEKANVLTIHRHRLNLIVNETSSLLWNTSNLRCRHQVFAGTPQT